MNFSNYSTKSKEDIFAELKSSSQGLSSKEAILRQETYGFNEVQVYEIHWWKILLRQFASPFENLLLCAGVGSYFLGETTNAIMIFTFIILNAMIGFFQEYQAERGVYLLKKFIVSHDKVLRDNKETLIESRSIVPGDIVFLEPGDIVPADIRIIEEKNLNIDESALTGESAPVKKLSQSLEKEAADYSEASNIGFCGTKVVSGRGVGLVFQTGRNTSFGEITKLTLETYRQSAVAKGIERFSKFILYLVLATISCVFFLHIFIKGTTNLTDLLIFSIALAVTIIPEALPIVMTCALSRSALALAKNKVVVKRLSAMEDLGSIEILCTDKTGTITENILNVSDIYPYGIDKEELIFYAAAASPTISKMTTQGVNSFDSALFAALSDEKKEKLSSTKIIEEIPFDPNRKRNTCLITFDSAIEVVTRGAQEVMIDRCANLTQEDKDKLNEWRTSRGKEGKRVIALAKKVLQSKDIKNLEDQENQMIFLGFISFDDPLKPTAAEALKKAQALNIQVKILTGDSPEVAGAVAMQLGLIKSFDEVVSGVEFETMSPAKQEKTVQKTAVFARVSPVQKYRIIELLQLKHEVGFLGEGINDAPALKVAQVGLVVDNASDIAKDAADIVLLKNSLKIIVDGIEKGRDAFANCIKYIKFMMASNVSSFYTVALASLLIDYLPMLPLQILLVNFLSDLPMISISADTVDIEEIKKVQSLKISGIISIVLLLGFVSTIFDFAFFAFIFKETPAIVQTHWFMYSLIAELLFFFSIRTKKFMFFAKRPPTFLLLLISLSISCTVILPFTSLGHEVFKFITPVSKYLILIFVMAFACTAAVEVLKLFYYKFLANHSKTRLLGKKTH